MSKLARVLVAGFIAVLLGWLPFNAHSQAPAPASAPDEQQALQSAKTSMVRVSVITFYGSEPSLEGWGSGFVIAPGYVVTNFHVVEEADAGRAVLMVTPAQSTEAKPVVGRIVQVWEAADLALIRVEELTAPALTLATGDPDQTKAVRALGYPAATCLMLGCRGRDIFEPAQPNATEGTIAILEERAPNGAALPTIFHTAAISSGNSGGPLIDRCGRVLGVNTWTASGQVGSDGHVSLPSGQNVASRAATLVRFLDRAGVSFASDPSPCMTAADVAAADAQRRLDEAEETLRRIQREREAQVRAEAAAKAKADADTRMIMMAAAVLALLVAAGGGGYLIWRRRSLPSETPEASPATPKAPSALTLLAGLVVLALLAGGGLVAFLVQSRPASTPVAPEPAAAPLTGLQRLDCTPDPAQSFGAEPAQMTSFIFDPVLQCVNSRTAYAKTPDGYERFIVHRDSPTVTRNRIAGDLRTFTQEEFALPREQWKAWTAAMRKPPECALVSSGVPGVEARLAATSSLRGQLPQLPVGKATRRCVSGR